MIANAQLAPRRASAVRVATVGHEPRPRCLRERRLRRCTALAGGDHQLLLGSPMEPPIAPDGPEVLL